MPLRSDAVHDPDSAIIYARLTLGLQILASQLGEMLIG